MFNGLRILAPYFKHVWHISVGAIHWLWIYKYENYLGQGDGEQENGQDFHFDIDIADDENTNSTLHFWKPLYCFDCMTL